MTEELQLLEWHDSVLSQINLREAHLDLCLRPAYVHVWERIDGRWKGRGFLQDVDVRIFEARCDGPLPKGAVSISDAELRIAEHPGPELLLLEAKYLDPVALDLELDDGSTIRLQGRGLEIAQKAERRFLEDLPEDLAPDRELG